MKEKIKQNNKVKGTHLLVDLINLDEALCLDSTLWLKSFIDAANLINVRVINKVSHKFVPPYEPGFTAFILLDSSHFSIHTYSNEKKAALDLFTCKGDINVAFKLIMESLNIKDENIAFIKKLNRFNNE